MTTVNPSDRASIEAAYGLDDFVRDANRNADPQALVHHGVSVTPARDGGGADLVQASRHVGEEAPDRDRVFLAPFRVEEDPAQDDAGYDPGTRLPRPAGPERDYAGFIDRVAEAAASAQSPGPIGLHEDRLKGFHGG